MTSVGAVKDELKRRGHSPEEANSLMWTHMSVFFRYRDDLSTEHLADKIEHAEKERKKSIIVNAVTVIAIVIFVVVLKKFGV